MSGVNYLCGIKTDNFVILAADSVNFFHGMLVASQEHDKFYSLGERLLMCCLGEDGDVEQFGDYVARNLELYRYRNGYEIRPRSAAHFTRKVITDNLRSQDYYVVDTVLGGFDAHDGKAYLALIDHLGAHVDDTNYLFRGTGGRLGYSILDKLYRSDMSETQAVDALKSCLKELKERFIARLPTFRVFVIDAAGKRRLDDISL